MHIHKSWCQHVPMIQAGYHERLLTAIDRRRVNTTIYPPSHRTFYALNVTPFEQVKVVIVGQDPYHGPGQANGLAFSVPEGVQAPPSLRNIFKELNDDIYKGKELSFSTDLTRWAIQGVLLLNASLTVEAGKAGSHRDTGWQQLTNQILETLSEKRSHLVFLLWGRHAQEKKHLLDTTRHCILEAPHPSPLSAYRGFLGCNHFSKSNRYLVEHQQEPIVW
jgi:uracil-DNA glycosylase